MRLTALLLALLSPAAWAAEESAMNAADVSWMMVATEDVTNFVSCLI